MRGCDQATASFVSPMLGGVTTPVALRRTARIGRYLPWALVRYTKSCATIGVGTGMSPPPSRCHSSRPDSRSYPPISFQPFTRICFRLFEIEIVGVLHV